MSYEVAAKAVVEWNKKAGVKNEVPFTPDWWRACELQGKLLVEEAQEALEGATYSDKQELLDGVVDTFVILSKFIDMLEFAGFDVLGALEAIQANNDLKIYKTMIQALEVKDKLEEVKDESFYVAASVYQGEDYFTVRRSDGKIAKAVDFPKVDLNDFIPKG